MYNVLNIPRCTHDILPLASWQPSGVLNKPQCTHGITPPPPPVYRTHIIYYGSTAPSVTCRSSKKEDGHYASPDWIRLIVVYLKFSLPCNTMFLIRHSNK